MMSRITGQGHTLTNFTSNSYTPAYSCYHTISLKGGSSRMPKILDIGQELQLMLISNNRKGKGNLSDFYCNVLFCSFTGSFSSL